MRWRWYFTFAQQAIEDQNALIYVKKPIIIKKRKISVYYFQ